METTCNTKMEYLVFTWISDSIHHSNKIRIPNDPNCPAITITQFFRQKLALTQIRIKMKVIVAGYPKTGTKTLNAALTRLGYKVYDYPENALDLGDEWGKIMRYGWTAEDFRRIYKDVDAVVDVPCCYFWEEIHKAFPDSKIILSVREDEEAWLRSFQNQMKVSVTPMSLFIMKCFSPTFRKMQGNMECQFSRIIFGVPDVRLIGHQPHNEELLKLKYRAHNAYVKHNAPADKLLVYKVTEGWDPLCKFLQVQVPDEPFPHKNKGGKGIVDLMASKPAIKKMYRELIISLLFCTSMFGVGGYFLYKHGFWSIWSSALRVIQGFK